MDVEELVQKYICRNGWSFAHDGECAEAIRAALTEAESCMAMEHNLKMLQVDAAHAIEMRAYEATVANLEARVRELEAERGVPEGWQPVPAEPTDEMIDHGCDAADAFRVDIVRAYQAMLSAAPQPKKENV